MTARSGNRAARRRQKAESRRRPRMPSPQAIDAAIQRLADPQPAGEAEAAMTAACRRKTALTRTREISREAIT
jgi:hypothetical protein